MRPSTYFADERARNAALIAIVDASPVLAAAVRQVWETGSAPAVRLRCPRGHLLLTVQVGAYEHDGHLLPLMETAGSSVLGRAPAAVDSSPSGGAHVVCSEPGCPHRVRKDTDVCQDGHRQADVPQALRTTLRCRRCSYVCPHRQERLLKLYAGALQIGRDELTLQ